MFIRVIRVKANFAHFLASDRFTTRMSWLRLVLALSAKSLVNPAVGLALVRTGWRFRRRRWMLQVPFLPVPDRTYLRWRMYTAYGDERAVPPAADVIRYARWATRSP